jgi:N-acetyltransferase
MTTPVPPITLEPVTLSGSTVHLESLNSRHKRELSIAAKDETIWTHTAGGSSEEEFGTWFNDAIHQHQTGGALVFAIYQKLGNKLVGSSRYLNIERSDRWLEIGNTWYNSDFWGSKVNPECKLLLMTHAFETLGCFRVEYRCDARNKHSQGAILKLGAKKEGILRRHKRTRDDYWRDTVQFSILDNEWPLVKAGLKKRLA